MIYYATIVEMLYNTKYVIHPVSFLVVGLWSWYIWRLKDTVNLNLEKVYMCWT